ncbi:MAG: crotonase/enoyl-CoA hydratase family protein [Gammaproteobacteria bacterium]|nr:crotonase/enoyl-CoA hydratase family protein [Gammaproteobacteria bacterium]
MTNDVTAAHTRDALSGAKLNTGLGRSAADSHNRASVSEDFLELEERLYESVFEEDYGVLWAYLKPACPPKFTAELVADLRNGQREVSARVRQELANGVGNRLRYQVFASRIPGIFSLGGDLALFRRCLAIRDRGTLRRYAMDCVDIVHTNATNYELPITTISLVQGQAMGGGFEAALAANVVVAERQCKMGLPEILFNLFPGMGAYHLLTRRLTPVQAERFIESGRTYTAEELYDMGVIDVLADEGRGEEAVRDYIKSHDRHFQGRQALRRAIQASSPALDRGALRRAVDVWLDAALALTPKDEQTMGYLLRAQARLTA